MSKTNKKDDTAVESIQPEEIFHGIGVSPGVAVGPVFLVGGRDDRYVVHSIPEEDVPGEIARLEDAVILTRHQIREIQKNVIVGMAHGDPAILDAHLMVLDDRAFMEEVLREISTERLNAESVLWTVANTYTEALSKVADDYLRERVADIRDVVRRIVRNLSGEQHTALGDVSEVSIVVANDLAPSETASLPRDLVRGFATDLGSPTSHTAVMARGMEIPAVVGTHDISERVQSGQEMLIDGNKGMIVLNPSKETLDRYGEVIKERQSIKSDLTTLKDEPAETKDGTRVVLSANIEMPSDIEAVLQYGADGVGLFRSEYAYLSDAELPSEDDVAVGYKIVAEGLAPASVIIRTLDVGGDKFASYMGFAPEANPFLGVRSIRFSLSEPEIFKAQLRAILRASAYGNVKVMYPLVSSAEEVMRANALLEEAKEELRTRGKIFNEDIEVGVMIETPSAALTADLIAPHVSFFSLGTNDLIQYTIAVDRVNERLAYLYQPTHPAIIRLINETVEAGLRHGIWVGVCGEMAGDPVIVPLLIGLGVNELSVAPQVVPMVKDVIRNITIKQAKELAALAVQAKSAENVLEHCRDLIRQVAPEILELTA